MSDRLSASFRAARRDEALAVLEGFHALKHALRFGAHVTDVRCRDRAGLLELANDMAPDLLEELSGIVQPVDAETFATLAPRAHETGVIALARRPAAGPAAVLTAERAAPILLLERPSHLGNIGAAIRVAAAMGAAAVLVTGEIDPWHPTVLRASAGLHFALPVLRLNELPAIRPLVALDPQGEPLHQTRIPNDSILAFGSERGGLSDATLARAELRLRIDMEPRVSSLNLATSAGIALHHWRTGSDK